MKSIHQFDVQICISSCDCINNHDANCILQITRALSDERFAVRGAIFVGGADEFNGTRQFRPRGVTKDSHFNDIGRKREVDG